MPIKLEDKHQVSEDKIWFKKWWPENVPHNIKFEEKSLNDLLDEQVEKYASDNFIYFMDTWVTYKQFHDYVLSFATALANLNIRKGDVIAIHLPNSIQYVVSYFAIARIGAISTGINPTYEPMEILHQFDITHAKVLIVQDKLFQEKIRPIIDKSTIGTVIYTNVADLAVGISSWKRIIGKKMKEEKGGIPTGKVDYPIALKFKNLIKTRPNVPKLEIDVKKDPITYKITGGTSGVPKAAVLTHFNVLSNAMQCKYWLGGEHPCLGSIGILPLFHSFAHTAIMLTTLAMGGWMMLFAKPPTQAELCAKIEELQCPEGLVYAGAEILFKRFSEFRDRKKYPSVMGKLKLCISGAGPLHKEVRDKFIKYTKGNIVEGYGLTEASPAVSVGNLFGESPVEVLGLPIPGTEWGIWPADDFSKGPICLGNPNDDNFGEEHEGEICVHGPQVMLEYLDQPEETAETIKEYNGKLWLLTGDKGYMNKDGTIKIGDRKKQLIKYKGYSIYPREVEELIMKHEKIAEVAVAGLPHDEFGEIVKAWIELKPDSTLTPEEITNWAKENITHYKRPQLIEIIQSIPKNLVGKVRRRVLQVHDPMWIAKYGIK